MAPTLAVRPESPQALPSLTGLAGRQSPLLWRALHLLILLHICVLSKDPLTCVLSQAALGCWAQQEVILRGPCLRHCLTAT